MTLSVFVAPAPFIGDFNTNKATLYWEEMTGVHIDWIQVPAQDKEQKLSLMLSSGSDLPDVISTSLSFEQVILYGAQGLFIPLNDLIEEYGHGIHKVSKLEPNARNVITAPDGNIYALPYYNDCYHCRYAQRAWINVDWLQRLGLEMPETTEELVDVLRAFKENDANGNGKDDEIPLLSQANSWHSDSTAFLMNPFAFNPGNSTCGAMSRATKWYSRPPSRAGGTACATSSGCTTRGCSIRRASRSIRTPCASSPRTRTATASA